MGWVSPTGHETPTDWSDPSYAYDGDTATRATFLVGPSSYTPFLVLTHPAIISNKLRYYSICYIDPVYLNIDVDVYKDGTWIDVYFGSCINQAWEEKAFTQGSVTKVRVRFQNTHSTWSRWSSLFELELWEVVVKKAKPASIIPLMRLLDFI